MAETEMMKKTYRPAATAAGRSIFTGERRKRRFVFGVRLQNARFIGGVFLSKGFVFGAEG